MAGTVYFLKAETGEYKIGFTRKLMRDRLASLQTGCPCALYVLATVEGTHRLEAQLHDHFKGSLIRGEWYRESPALLDLIERASRGDSSRLLPARRPGRRADSVEIKPLTLTARVLRVIESAPNRRWTSKKVCRVLGEHRALHSFVGRVLRELFCRGKILRGDDGRYHAYQIQNITSADVDR